MEEERIDTTLLPRLTKENWRTEFKDRFRNYALQCGEAGDIVITGQDIPLVRPLRDEVRRQGEANVPVYPDDVRGDKKFEIAERRYHSLKEGKKKLISKLIGCMDKEVFTSVSTVENYEL